ncbi:hypothetical protein A2643_02915 [Candidatus Nomurabacteria bacterium RIFCSPHIGHO2_01_FULL_39_220]|uniref:tRNA_anti-like n=1 Tax=Candidatus Nomurabacteria bacterium RIFCSPLOWO2_02_FULL_40_67 TaxID=1801787 RepID=A0A1F6Y626_9BACT|nr:MAG: hypothetical protein UU01_C0018G0008 [Parcubacteria group bacterium GW2011_GWA2_40_37]OGI70167.1 MAG: hypothetical protein A2643_02915 [Candidatus Nomurabacteria bacterium RIFCSPHIGHO2_01_FULL_39_220]OGI72390.1 MAG: hypothetical protein A2W56_03330 [Candidatus Nomurabacteria bacterium RIFCSPHIGHO2_02_41_18]OGI78634.1 MAG: hypothetical protein A3C65_02580 [Candidatus Nomurabacteria bacterium RIFCSPHIGHO2_02_FULL_41_150]OGI81691.1 MAG: hypothetical protein A3E03_04145 [Candidatus Nomuraba
MENDLKKIKWKHAVLIIVGLFIFYKIAFFFMVDSPTSTISTPTPTTQEPQKETTKTTADGLVIVYNSNQITADAMYKDKIVEVTGIIDDIGRDILGTAYVTLKGPSYIDSPLGVQCMFNKSNESMIAGLGKGKTVTLQGEISSVLLYVLMNNCRVVSS